LMLTMDRVWKLGHRSMGVGETKHHKKGDGSMTGYMSRKARWLSLATASMLAVAWVTQPAQALMLDFSNVTNAELVFNPGGDFAFESGAGSDFIITGGSGGGSAAVGLEGNIIGTFSMGVPANVGGGAQMASVTGAGTLDVESPSGNLTADIFWDQIASLGTGGIVNVEGVVNVSSITYTGDNPALQDLAAGGSAILTVSFQFAIAADLETLRAEGGATSYSGSIIKVNGENGLDVPDPGSSMVLLGLGFLGLCGYKRFRK
jgi:hypothetical protein